MKINCKLDLLIKIKIHLVQYVAILKPVYREYKLLVYKINIYKSREENKYKV